MCGRLSFLCLLLAVVGLPAAAKSPVRAARELYEEQIRPLLADRAEHFDVKIEPRARGALIRIESHVDGRRTGLYGIRLNDYTASFPEGAPDVNPVARGEAHGELMLPLDWRRDPVRIDHLLRGLVRGDEALHPMNRPPGSKWRVTGPQRHVLDQLHAGQAAAKAEGVGQRALVLAPPGFGKTKVVGILTRELGQQDQLPQIIVYVIQNRDVLDKSIDALAKARAFSGEKIRRVYGAGSKEPLFGRDATLIGASRTVTHRELPDFLRRTRQFRGRIIYVLDEYQHVGKVDGQFSEILRRLDLGSRPRDILLGLTATPWHTDVGAIHHFFRNHIVTTHVTPAVLDDYVKHERLIELSRLVMFRHMAAGWLPPLYSYQQIEYRDPGTDLPTYAFLNDYEMKRTVPSETPDRREKIVRIHAAFVERILTEIRGTLQKVDDETVYFNRGLVFVPSIVHAEAYAQLMNERARPGEKISARAYHSDVDSKRRNQTLAWFEDDEAAHKYLIVIRTIGEGFDAPAVNHVVLAKPYSEIDPVGMRELLQNLGRLTRIAPGKWRTFVSDFTGDMRRLLFKGLDQDLVRSIFVDGGRIDMRELPIVREPTVDAVTLRPKHFASKPVPIALEPLTESSEDDTNAFPRWTVARVLLDPRVVPHFLPGAPFSSSPLRSLGDYLCQDRAREDDPGRVDRETVERLLTVLKIDPGDDLADACRRGLLTRAYSTTPAGTTHAVDAAEPTLVAAFPHSFGRRTFVTGEIIGGWMKLPTRLNQAPRSQIDPWSRRWSLAELLLHPLLMAVTSKHLRAPNLARALLADDNAFGTARAQLNAYVGDWESNGYLDVLRQARALNLLPETAEVQIYDRKRWDRVIANLTAFSPAIFGQSTRLSDLDFWRHALTKGTDRLTRRRARALFLLRGLPVREFKVTSAAAPAPWLDSTAKIVAGDEGRVVGDRRITAEGLSQFTERTLFEHLNTSATLNDDALHAKMIAFATARGPWRLANVAAAAPPPPESEPRGWTLARLLVHPGVLTRVYPEVTFRKSLARSTHAMLGFHLCRQVRRQPFTGVRSASIVADSLLIGLDLDFTRWQQLGLQRAIEAACEGELFKFKREDLKSALARVDAREAALIVYAPEVFSRRTHFTDEDLAPDRSLLARLPLSPDFARPIVPGAWERAWTLAQYLANPHLPYLLGFKEYKPMALHVIEGTLAPAGMSADELSKLRQILGAHFRFASQFKATNFDDVHRDWGTESFGELVPDLASRTVDMSNARIYRLARQPGVRPELRQLVEASLISRGNKVPPEFRCEENFSGAELP